MSFKIISARTNNTAKTETAYTGEERTLGELVSHIRKDRGLSIGKLAKAAEIHPSCIKDLESNYLRSMNKQDLNHLASALDLSMDERHRMFDLSANGKIPEDITEFLEKSDTAIDFLRIAMDGYPAKKEMCSRLMKNIIKMSPEKADRVLQALNS